MAPILHNLFPFIRNLIYLDFSRIIFPHRPCDIHLISHSIFSHDQLYIFNVSFFFKSI